jgi:hypothetical protein
VRNVTVLLSWIMALGLVYSLLVLGCADPPAKTKTAACSCKPCKCEKCECR